MKLNKSQILKALQADLKAADVLQKETIAKINEWRREYNGEKYGNEVKGKSQIVSKDIKKQAEWLHPSLLDPFVNTQDIVKVNPVTWEDTEAARQNEILLNYQFCRQFDRYNFMTKALKILQMEGTLVVQTGWDYLDEEVEVEKEVVVEYDDGSVEIEIEKVVETRIKKNQPTAVVCRNEDIFIDPTCMDDMDKCQFVVHRYETDYSTLKQDGRYKNLDKVMKSDDGESSSDTDFDEEDKTSFRFQDNPRKKLLVYEYWGNYDVNNDGIAEPIVCAWIGNTIIRLESNPYPDQKPPFLIVPFNSVPFQIYGESDAELISDNQKIKTAITRGIIDNMAQSNNGQIGVRKGALQDMANKKKFLEGKNFEFVGTPNDFWYGSYNQIPSSAFDMLAVQNNEIESLTAVKSFSGGLTGQSLGSTATSTRGVLDATAVRRLNRVRNIAENLVKPLMRKWMAYNNEFLEEEQVVRVTNAEFVQIRRDDLEGLIDLEISISTAEDNGAKAEQLSFLLQTLGNSLPFELSQKVLGEIARLNRMPLLEKEILEFRAEPDPIAEKMKQLELERMVLENAKIQAEIQDLMKRATENAADTRKKIAEATLKEAQARKYEEEADYTALKFVKDESEYDRKMKEYEFEQKRLHDIEMALIQAKSGDTNIGLPRR